MALLLLALLISEDRPSATDDARAVVAAVVAAATDNARAAKPKTGDDLAALYVRAAATAAAKLPEKRAARAFLVGIGVALDTSKLLRTVPLIGPTITATESDDERQERLKVLGKPTVHGRHDLAQHFAVSAALTAILGASLAESAGVAKELADARDGGSGFSFADLAADFAGIELAKRVAEKPSRLADLATSFEVKAYALPPGKDLPEDLSAKAFAEKYGGVRDKRYLAMREGILRRVGTLKGFAE